MTTGDAVKAKYLPPAVAVDCEAVRVVVSSPVVIVVSAMALLVWNLVLHQSPLSVVVTIAVFCFAFVIARREFHAIPLAQLVWSRSKGWSCLPKSTSFPTELQPCSPMVVLDWQRVMLLRVTGANGHVDWVWVQRGNAVQWHRMRCALFNGTTY